MPNRRQFLAASSAALATSSLSAAPAVVTKSKTDSQVIVGDGDYRYEVQHDWLKLPEKYTWQTTHNVAVDSQGLVYVIHEGSLNQKDHPAIFVFDPDGKFIRGIGAEFQGGGHGIEVRKEGSQEFLYVANYKEIKSIAKLDLKGENVWTRRAPMASGVYAEGEDTSNKNEWGRNRFLPTNFAFLDDGGFLLTDGYGSFRIHRYDSEGNWVSHFGEVGKKDGQFNTPHGIWIDNRGEGEPLIVVADRANARLQWLTLDGKHVRTQGGFQLPANIDIRGDLMLVPDLVAEVVLLDKANKVVARLGLDPDWAKDVGKRRIRSQPKEWRDGRFVHPHDACFDNDGNILVAEWVATGRVSKLRRVS